jgi:hypothetical protein
LLGVKKTNQPDEPELPEKNKRKWAMENRKLMIIAVGVVVCFSSFMMYRHFKGENENVEHAQKTLAVVLQAAKGSDRVGLNHMAGAVKAYHKDNKAYPPNLQVLYPRYIPLKAFIDELNWSYQAGGQGFIVSRSLLVSGQTMVASINQDMIISGDKGPAVAGVVLPAVATPPPVPLAPLEQPFEPLNTDQPAPEPPDRGPVVARAEARTVVADAPLSNMSLASIASRDFLVWRYPDGSLGFGNVQYPMAKRLYIAMSDRWYRVDQNGMDGMASTVRPSASAQARSQAVAMPKDETVDAIQGSGERYLAWKDKNGVIGFGNVQHPQSSAIAFIHVDGRWEKTAN